MTCNGEPDSSLWVIGVLMSIAASVCTNLGVNMQKYSFLEEAKKCVSDKRTYIRQPYWASGLFLVIFGSFGDFVALGFAPQTLATPVGGFTMVANVVFAHYFLKEAFKKRDAIATFLIIVGVVLVAAFADKQSQCYTIDDLIGLYSQPALIVYIVLVVFGCAFVYYWIRRIEHIYKFCGPSSVTYKKVAKYHPILYPALSGIFGAQSVLFAKSTAELFKMTFSGDNQFTVAPTYAIVLGMFVCIFCQIHWLAKGLQYFDAVFVIPIFQCFFISFSIIGGGVYFDEFASISTLRVIMFFVGVFITLLGVVLLSQRDMTRLRPISRFRSGVRTVMFIKRAQKIRGYKYNWIQGEALTCEKKVKTIPNSCVVVIPEPKPLGQCTKQVDTTTQSLSNDLNARLLSPSQADVAIDMPKMSIDSKQNN